MAVTEEPMRGEEVDAIADQLEQAGLITVTMRSEGQIDYTLTREGRQVAHGLALSSDEHDLLEALLDASDED